MFFKLAIINQTLRFPEVNFADKINVVTAINISLSNFAKQFLWGNFPYNLKMIKIIVIVIRTIYMAMNVTINYKQRMKTICESNYFKKRIP